MPKETHKINDLETWVKEIDRKLDNHLVHVAADISEIKNDLIWIKKFFWLVASVAITAIIGALLGLVLK